MAVEVKMPQLGLTMEEGTVTKWLKQEGDAVKAGDILLEITTDKLTSEVASEAEGILLKIVAQEGEDIPVKGLLAYIGEAGEQVGGVAAPATAAAPAEAAPVEAVPVFAAAPAVAPVSGGRVRISPLARKTAVKLGVDYSGIKGTGPMGRIVQKDILAAAETVKAAPVAAAAPAAPKPAAQTAGSVELMDGDEVVKLSGMRKVVAERMTKSAQEIPVVTQNVKIDVTDLMSFRKKVNNELFVKYSLNDYILKATAKAVAFFVSRVVRPPPRNSFGMLCRGLRRRSEVPGGCGAHPAEFCPVPGASGAAGHILRSFIRRRGVGCCGSHAAGFRPALEADGLRILRCGLFLRPSFAKLRAAPVLCRESRRGRRAPRGPDRLAYARCTRCSRCVSSSVPRPPA